MLHLAGQWALGERWKKTRHHALQAACEPVLREGEFEHRTVLSGGQSLAIMNQ